MLPFGGQGANQAIEDAGALGALFKDVVEPQHIPARLQLFEAVRRLRAARVQTLSKVRLGRENEVENELRKYADPPGSGKRPCCQSGLILEVDSPEDVPTTFEQRYQHDFAQVHPTPGHPDEG